MKSTLYYLHALSALHLGTGQGAGVIDLPIAREKATQLPYAPGTGIKGVLREEMRPDADATEHRQAIHDWESLFGPARIQDDDGFAGALAVGDAHLLCLPVRSLAGTFAWATCPFILSRYIRAATAADAPAPPSVPSGFGDESALTSTDTVLALENQVVLEDLDLQRRDGADAWAGHIAAAVFADDRDWQALFSERFVILPDGVLDFLAETATEVRARIRIDQEKRIVAKGALWYEENLPAETLMYGLLGADRARRGDTSAAAMLDKLPSGAQRLQLGGKASVGRGLVNFINLGG